MTTSAASRKAAPQAPDAVHIVEPYSVYSVEDAIRIFRLRKSTIRREVRAGRLRIAKRAGRYFLLGQWLIEWIEGGELKRQSTDADQGQEVAGMTATTNGRPAPPDTLKLQRENIPQGLASVDRHLVWRYVWQPGPAKYAKVPFNAAAGRTAREADVTDPANWSPLSVALAAYDQGVYAGTGFAFDAAGEFGIDLDKCRNPETGEIAPWAWEIVRRVNTYTEISPSGTGVKLFGHGCKLGWMCRCKQTKYETGAVEIYDRDRYFAVTGHRLDGTPTTLEPCQDALEEVYRLVFPEKARRGKGKAGSGASVNVADADLLRIASAARNGDKFNRLWRGSTEGYGSPSEADLALCNLLAFYCGPDPERIDRLFRSGRLMRDKWDERRGERTYGRRTIDKALEDRTEFYAPRRRGQNSEQATSPPPSGGEPSPGTDGTTPGPCEGYAIILDYFREFYCPVFRRGSILYSRSQRREIRMGEATAGCPRLLIDRLMSASNVPRERNGTVIINALPSFFNNWSKSAWVDLLNSLPIEEAVTTTDESAAEEFTRLVAGALCSQVTLGQTIKKLGQLEVNTERRSIIDWCGRFAKPGAWESIRSYLCWCRLDKLREDEVILRVAIRHELFGQVNADRRLIEMPPKTFARQAALYGVGKAEESERPQGKRAILLSQDFLADLTSSPVAPEDAKEEAENVCR